MRSKKALTLFELLVAVAVISTIIGIAVSSQISSKRSAKGAVDLSNMRQLGLAMELYRSQTETQEYDLPNLVATASFDLSILHSPLDQVPNGYTNWLVREHLSQHDKNHSYLSITAPLSYVGADAYNLDSKTCDFFSEYSGWLIRTSQLTKVHPGPKPKQPILLLSGDTSVKSIVPKFSARGGGFELVIKDVFCP